MRTRLLSHACPIAILTFSLVGCGESNPSTTSGAGGTGGSGGGSGGTVEPPDYAKAFPQDSVPRLDITISPENWQRMVDDMTSMVGDFGTGSMMPGGGGAPTPEAIAACNGLANGAMCTMTVNGMSSMGTCMDMMGTIACQTGGGGFQIPPELTMPCAGLTAGDACTATFMGMTITSMCADAFGTLACLPEGGPGGPGGPGEGGVDLIPHTPVYAECDIQSDSQSWNHVGIRFKGAEKTNVEEYCVSEGWVRVTAGNAKDRRGNPLTIKVHGPVEPYFRDKAQS